MVYSREITRQESGLLNILVEKAGMALPIDWESQLLVMPMKDDGMGGLLLFPNGEIIEGREFGSQVSEYQYTDCDGVEVIVSLNIDKEGKLFELDVWKTDFSPLRCFPELE
ncbi:hypothetical protein SAMN04489724_3063 [Algoriphagus locisalis]|uniref:DUF6984 domain-containing protein n=1 Tax=Algoriphagus locisalis TaxID=305507 RepID=A0A1I7CCH9_9BACT|nr:hypothetical protein [Algoriphagus locisalis]SFT97122.1 hypothetical protein SAMN04489724_3063 [Algoriphagus locisalis]